MRFVTAAVVALGLLGATAPESAIASQPDCLAPIDKNTADGGPYYFGGSSGACPSGGAFGTWDRRAEGAWPRGYGGYYYNGSRTPGRVTHAKKERT